MTAQRPRPPHSAPAELARSAALLADMEREFPKFKLVPKAGHRLSIAIDRALRLLTAGRQNRYLSHYHTVLGYTLYVPPTWEALSDVERVILLRHERVHLRQRRRYGSVGMALLYLLPLLPLGLALGRARIEWEAYTETLRATAELKGLDAARDPHLRSELIGRFTGPDYGWMWPFPGMLNAWYDAALERIEATLSAANRP